MVIVQTEEVQVGTDVQRGVTLVYIWLKTVTVIHSPLVLVETGTICFKEFQEHCTNHNTVGVISILKQEQEADHFQYHPVQEWMDVVLIKVVVHFTLSSQVAEVEHHTLTQVAVTVAGVPVDL